MVNWEWIEKAYELLIRLYEEYKKYKRKNLEYNNYFYIIGSNSLDYVIYPLGLRPKIPLMDLFYFEYLHFLLKNGEKQFKIYVYPVLDLSTSIKEYKKDLRYLISNVEKIFQEFRENVIIRDVSNINIRNCEITKEFLEALKYISVDFIQKLHKMEKIPELIKNIQSFCDFNKYHPSELKLVNLYIHLVHTWNILNDFQNELNNHIHSKNVAILAWESELAKLGIFYYRAGNHFNPIAILGRTIGYKSNKNGFKPIPTFKPLETLNIFDDIKNILNLLSKKETAELQVINKLLLIILENNYNKNYSLFKKENDPIQIFNKVQLQLEQAIDIKENRNLIANIVFNLELLHKIYNIVL